MKGKEGQGRVFYNHTQVGNQPVWSGRIMIDGVEKSLALWKGKVQKENITYLDVRVSDVMEKNK
tara:strand:+ start:347 stop:538 length:192 start_codon:yes stop_codon:yes gene_type:complete